MSLFFLKFQGDDNTDINWSPMNFRVTIGMDDLIHLQTRRRYRVWDLLGDVGGFNDGLLLVCQIFMTTYSAVVFKVDWMRYQVFDKGGSQEEQSLRDSKRLVDATQDLANDGRTGKLTVE